MHVARVATTSCCSLAASTAGATVPRVDEHRGGSAWLWVRVALAAFVAAWILGPSELRDRFPILLVFAIALGLGTLLGIVAAYLPARLERFVLIVFDVVSSFPSMVLALAIVAVFGPSTLIVVVIVAITLTPHFGRVARAQVLAWCSSAC